MNDFLNLLRTMFPDTLVLSAVAIVIGLLSIAISITNIILTKQTSERDEARIAQEEQQRLAKVSK